MNRLARTAAAGLAATCVALTGCSSGHAAKQPEPTPRGMTTAAFLKTVRPLYPASNTDHDLIRGGKVICRALNAGASYEQAFESMAAVTGARKARIETDAAVRTFCPAHLAELP